VLFISTDLLTVNPDGGSPDIRDGQWKTICVRLYEASDSETAGPAQRVWELLSQDIIRDKIITTALSNQTNQEADKDLLNALNAIIISREFYRPASFRTLTDPVHRQPDQLVLPRPVRDLLMRVQQSGIASLSELEVQRLNRQLVEASFPEAIVPTVPSGMSIVHQLSRIYTDTYGPWSYGIFMFGGFCTLFSTIVVVVAASGRMWTDLLSSLGVFQYGDVSVRQRYNRLFQTLSLVGFLAITWFMPENPVFLVILGQTINGAFNTPILMFGIVWLAFHTDRRLRMSPVTAVLLVSSVVVIAGCLAIGVFHQVAH